VPLQNCSTYEFIEPWRQVLTLRFVPLQAPRQKVWARPKANFASPKSQIFA
jgi:hypothetical protein